MSKGVQLWYYTRNIPSRSVAVAKVDVPPLTSAQLTSINNSPYSVGQLSVWKGASGYAGAPDFTAPDLHQSVQISGDSTYFIGNQFFELTNKQTTGGTPLYYQHALPAGVSEVTILDLNGDTITPPLLLESGVLYHDLDGAPYFVRYVTTDGFLTSTLLRYDKVFSRGQYTASQSKYLLTGRLLTVVSSSPYWIRFTDQNGYQVLPMYGYLPNTPWYPRIRFGITPPPVDWQTQRFVLPGGILQGTYIPGKILSSNLVEFERKNIYYDPQHLPDILVFDKNNVLKYALDGSSPNTPPRKGTLYNWKRGRVQSIDPSNARLNLAVSLDPTDIVYAFYNYYEPDVLYTDLDINPFTNPAVKNKIVQFYVKMDGSDPQKNLFYQILDQTGAPIPGATNDKTPGTGTPHVFAQLVVGASVSSTQFSFEDIRVRGGGLAPQYQKIPQATSFFDIGYWDGKPYPIGGALVVYLPLSILNSLSRGEVQGKVQATIPMGTLAVIRYFDEQGQEYV